MKYLLITNNLLIFILLINHITRSLNYIPLLILLVIMSVFSFIVIRLENSKF